MAKLSHTFIEKETNLIAIVIVVEVIYHIQITSDVANGRMPLTLVQLLCVQYQM